MSQNTNIEDVIIIGGGPAGYTAAIYAARAGFRTVVLEKLYAGGQMTQTEQIDNYPGFADGIDGYTLAKRMQQGAERFGARTIAAEGTAVNLKGTIKTVQTKNGMFQGKTVILATGADHRHLGVPGEEELIGKGISYCGACDGMFYKGKTVGVVGGGNSAAADSVLLSRLAEKVILIHRRDTLRAEKVYADSLERSAHIEFCWNCVVRELHGRERLTGITVENVKTGELKMLQLDGLFISIGREPATELFRHQVDLDEDGYIITDESMNTSQPGVFAAGDVRKKEVRQIVTATADGAVAAYSAEKYLGKENRE